MPQSFRILPATWTMGVVEYFMSCLPENIPALAPQIIFNQFEENSLFPDWIVSGKISFEARIACDVFRWDAES